MTSTIELSHKQLLLCLPQGERPQCFDKVETPEFKVLIDHCTKAKKEERYIYTYMTLEIGLGQFNLLQFKMNGTHVYFYDTNGDY